MKSFKTLLFLSATLSGFMLSACGVDASDTQGVQAEQEGAAQVSSEGSTTGPQCQGSIQCGGSTSTVVVVVSCKWTASTTSTQATCAAACPSGTSYKGGNCGVVVVDPPPPSTSALR